MKNLVRAELELPVRLEPIFLPHHKSETAAAQIFVEAFYKCLVLKFKRHGNVASPFYLYTLAFYIGDVKTCNAATNEGKQETLVGVLQREVVKLAQLLAYKLERHSLHCLIKRDNSVTLSLQALGLSHHCAEALYCLTSSTARVITFRVRPKHKNLVRL